MSLHNYFVEQAMKDTISVWELLSSRCLNIEELIVNKLVEIFKRQDQDVILKRLVSIALYDHYNNYDNDMYRYYLVSHNFINFKEWVELSKYCLDEFIKNYTDEKLLNLFEDMNIDLPILEKLP